MNVLEFLHRESLLLYQYFEEHGEMNHDEYMERRTELYKTVERWLDKGLHLETNADQGRLEEVRDCKT